MADALSDRRFDESRAGEVEPAPFGHQELIAHHREICAACNARAHNGGELRDAAGTDDGVVAKDAAEVILVREYVLLQR